jgi:hypothetical protein
MPGLSASSSAIRWNSTFFCSRVRVLNTVIWMYTTSAPGDAGGIAGAEVRGVMLCDGHELVVFGHVQCLAHRGVKAVKDCLSVGFRLSGAQ